MNRLSARGDSAWSYWPTVALVLLALCPGLIVATTLGLDNAAIANSLGTSPLDVSWASIWGSAGLALGVVLAAALAHPLATRTLYTGGLGLVILGAVVAAISPYLQILVAARIVLGVGTGLLLVAAISTLLTAFPPERLPLSVAVLGLAVVGAITAGPVIGGLVAQNGGLVGQNDAWRWPFAATAVLGALALSLMSLLPDLPAPAQRRESALPVLGLAALGIGLLFYGLGDLGWQDWADVSVWAPVAAGLAALFVTFIASAIWPGTPLPVRALGWPITLLGTLSAVVAAAAFAAMLGVLPVFLGGVRGLGLHDTGLVFWPGIAAAASAAIVAGFVVPSRGASVLPILGLAGLALAGWRLTQVADGTGAAAMGQLAGLLGLGAGLAVVPGLLLAVLRVPPVLVARLAALVLLLVVSGAALARATTLRALAAGTTAHYLGLAAQVQSGWAGDGGSLIDPTGAYLQQPTASGGAQAPELLRQALVLGLRESGTVILWIALLGIAASIVILVAGRLVRAPRALGSLPPMTPRWR